MPSVYAEGMAVFFMVCTIRVEEVADRMAESLNPG